jgi:hypothetical protein
MSTRSLTTLIVVLVLLLPAPLLAETKPAQLSLFTPIQIFPEGDDIGIFRLNLIYGRNASATGLDLGLVNHTTGAGSVGLQIGVFSYNESEYTGWQNGFVNAADGDFKGFQWGFVNYARSARGFQWGFVNYAETMYGLQIGLVNIIREGGIFPVFPIVNWSF